MEEKIQRLTEKLQDFQSTMNEHLHHEPVRPGKNPADAAPPEIKETIHSIQTKLDQLDNRTKVHSSRVPLPSPCFHCDLDDYSLELLVLGGLEGLLTITLTEVKISLQIFSQVPLLY